MKAQAYPFNASACISPTESSLLNKPNAGLLACIVGAGTSRTIQDALAVRFARNDSKTRALTNSVVSSYSLASNGIPAFLRRRLCVAVSSLQPQLARVQPPRNDVTNLVPYYPSALVPSKKCAFTLAEVLITLGIIGVVAAMTMPALIQKHNEKVTVTKLKKAYSVVSQAYLRAQNEYGEINHWGFNASSTTEGFDEETGLFAGEVYNNLEIFWSKLIPYMGVTSTCIDKGNTCSIPGQYNLDGTSRNKKSSTLIKLKDGMEFMGGWISNINCQRVSCGDFSVDINGADTPPNTVGKDVFYFYIYKNKIVPMGVQTAASGENKFETYCINGGNGYGCTAWVIYNENMDYLRCNDLSWDGKKTCK